MVHPIDDILIGLVKSGPGLLTTLLVVWLFLRDRAARRKEEREEEAAKMERETVRDNSLLNTLTNISGRCHDVQDNANVIHLQVVSALGSNGEVAERVVRLLDRMERRMNGLPVLRDETEDVK
jgi:hypothetical protein